MDFRDQCIDTNLLSSGQEIAEDESIAIVKTLFRSAVRMDVEGMGSSLNDTIKWGNPLMPTLVGKKTVLKALSMMCRVLKEYNVESSKFHVSDNVIVYERIETFRILWLVSKVPVVGIFVVKDGEITFWSDRFDWLTIFFGFAISFFTAPIGWLIEKILIMGRFLH